MGGEEEGRDGKPMTEVKGKKEGKREGNQGKEGIKGMRRRKGKEKG